MRTDDAGVTAAAFFSKIAAGDVLKVKGRATGSGVIPAVSVKREN